MYAVQNDCTRCPTIPSSMILRINKDDLSLLSARVVLLSVPRAVYYPDRVDRASTERVSDTHKSALSRALAFVVLAFATAKP